VDILQSLLVHAAAVSAARSRTRQGALELVRVRRLEARRLEGKLPASSISCGHRCAAFDRAVVHEAQLWGGVDTHPPTELPAQEAGRALQTLQRRGERFGIAPETR
jgi:hypothetical protein